VKMSSSKSVLLGLLLHTAYSGDTDTEIAGSTRGFVPKQAAMGVASAKGTTVVVWCAAHTSSSQNVNYFSRSAGGDLATWSNPALLDSTLTTINDQPKVATDGKGNWVAMGRPNPNTACEGRVMTYSSSDDGKTFPSKACVGKQGLAGATSNSVLNDATVHFCTDRFVATYHQRNYAPSSGTGLFVWCVAQSTDLGQTWTGHYCDPARNAVYGTPESAGNYVAYGPRFACNDDAWLIFMAPDRPATKNADTDIIYSRSTDKGSTWSASALLVGDTTTRDDWNSPHGSSCAMDSEGNVIFVYNSDTVQAGTISIKFVTSSDSGATWGSPGVIAAPTVGCTRTGTTNADGFVNQRNPQITTDGAGVFLVAWTCGSDHEIFMSSTSNLGVSWSTPTEIISARNRPVYPFYIPEHANTWAFAYMKNNDYLKISTRSSLDCKGVLSGTAANDLCGKCGGDSSSCATDSLVIEFDSLFSAYTKSNFEAILTASGNNQVALSTVKVTAEAATDAKLKVTITFVSSSPSKAKVKNLVEADAFKTGFGEAAFAPCTVGADGNACQNGGTPNGKSGGTCGCTCKSGFKGANCETRPSDAPSDGIGALDASLGLMLVGVAVLLGF